jgi:hypothetical protein
LGKPITIAHEFETVSKRILGLEAFPLRKFLRPNKRMIACFEPCDQLLEPGAEECRVRLLLWGEVPIGPDVQFAISRREPAPSPAGQRLWLLLLLEADYATEKRDRLRLLSGGHRELDVIDC